MDENIKKILDQVKDIPGIKVGFVFCDPNIMQIDSEIHDYKSAVRLQEHAKGFTYVNPDRIPDRILPVFWISDEEITHDDEYNILQYDIPEYVKFNCPKCGSYMYGSSENPDGSLTRYCHGNEKWHCDFSFPDSDDHLYFKAK